MGVVDPKFSPDGASIGFVYEHDIWVVPVSGEDEKQLTFGGSDLILHGDLDWVYPEELNVGTGYHWSPDSRHIAFLELDKTLVPTYPIPELVSRQAKVDLQRYPKPGDPNPRVRAGIVNVENGRTAWIDRAAEYIPRIDWRDGDTVAIQLLNRGQDELQLIYVDPKTGRSRMVLTETDAHWINVTNDLTFLDGNRFLWTSERSGFRHVYLYDDEKGTVLEQLTDGDWQVFGLDGFDGSAEIVYFSANCDNPIGRDLYSAKLDGSGLKRLTDGKGTHQNDLNTETGAYLDRFTSMAELGGTTFRSVGADRSAAFHEPPPIEGYDLIEPERTLLDTPDGHKIGLLVMKPRELEPGKKYSARRLYSNKRIETCELFFSLSTIFNEYTNESFLQRQELPPAHIFDGGVFARKRKLLENWSGNDFCMGEDVRAVVFGGKKSLHIDDPIQLEMVRVLIQSNS